MTKEQICKMVENQQKSLKNKTKEEKQRIAEKKSASMKIIFQTKIHHNKGKSWWHNTEGKSTLSLECPGKNWSKGRYSESG